MLSKTYPADREMRLGLVLQRFDLQFQTVFDMVDDGPGYGIEISGFDSLYQNKMIAQRFGNVDFFDLGKYLE